MLEFLLKFIINYFCSFNDYYNKMLMDMYFFLFGILILGFLKLEMNVVEYIFIVEEFELEIFIMLGND